MDCFRRFQPSAAEILTPSPRYQGFIDVCYLLVDGSIVSLTASLMLLLAVEMASLSLINEVNILCHRAVDRRYLPINCLRSPGGIINTLVYFVNLLLDLFTDGISGFRQRFVGSSISRWDSCQASVSLIASVSLS
jgi:hypothetical protein